MITLKQIEFLLPKKKIKIKEKYKLVSNAFLKNKIGATSLPRLSNKDSVVNLCTKVSKK